MTVAGLTDARPLPGLPLVIVGIALAFPAFRRLTPAGTLRAARGLPSAVLLRGFLTFAFFAADAYVALALQEWRGTSATESGLALTAATLSWTGGAWVQARWIGRLGRCRASSGSGSRPSPSGSSGSRRSCHRPCPIAVGVVAWAIAGLGMGFSYSPLSLTSCCATRRLRARGRRRPVCSSRMASGPRSGRGLAAPSSRLAHRNGGRGLDGSRLGVRGGRRVAIAGFTLAGRIRRPVAHAAEVIELEKRARRDEHARPDAVDCAPAARSPPQRASGGHEP